MNGAEGGGSPVVEYMPTVCQALGSIPTRGGKGGKGKGEGGKQGRRRKRRDLVLLGLTSIRH